MSTGFVERLATGAAELSHSNGDWLASVRHDALDRFSRLGFPTTRNEDWHFTNLAPLAAAALAPRTQPLPKLSAAALGNVELASLGWPTIVFVNGVLAPDLSTLEELPNGVVVSSLAAELSAGNETVRSHLSQLATVASHSFTALNTAYLNDGAFVHVAANVACSTPIRILHVTDATATGAIMHPRVLVVAEANSRITVVESFTALAEIEYMTNAVTEVHVMDGAHVTHCKVQRESRNAFHVGTSEARQGRDSHYVSFSFAVGARLSRTNIYTVLDGPGCGATLNGLYMVDGDQFVDHQTRIEHVHPSCFSREVYKGILDGSSHGVFNGKVYVHPEAQQTDGKQSNNNLLLSERAHIDTKPQLEIFADDVRCTHGATVGRIDEVALFYMRSRGLEQDQARQLLTFAFAADVLEQLENEEIKEELEALTRKRFTI